MLSWHVLQEDEIKGIDAEKSKTSSLPKSVQDLVCTIFDIEKMKNVMTEFEVRKLAA